MFATLRPAFVLCCALHAAACYQPEPALGLPCSTQQRECPDGQECGADNICRLAGSPGPDAEPCSVSTCEPEALAAGPTSADTVSAADPEYVFWTSAQDRQILRTGKTSLETDVLDERAAPYAPLGLAVDQSGVYWSDSSSSGAILFSAAAAPGAQNLATGQDLPLFVATDGDSVYWSNASGLVLRASKQSGALSMVAASLGDGPAGALVVDGTRVYFADTGGGRVYTVATDDSGDLAPVAEGQSAPLGVAADGQYIYWTSSGSGEVKRRLKAGGQEQIIADQQMGASFLAVGPGHIYWTNRSDGRVMRASKATLAVDAVAQQQDQPYGISLDGDALYWVNQGGDDRLMRLYPCACP